MKATDDQRSLLSALAVLSVTWGAPALPAQSTDGVGTFKDVVSLQTVGGVAISPDGSMVAYTVRTTDWDKNRDKNNKTL